MDKNKFVENIKILREEYKKWNAPIVTLISVQTKDPYKVLISTLLSLRTKDDVTAKASYRLFEKADTPERMIKLSEDEIQKLIFPVGFYKTKAKTIIETSQILIDKYDSKVPDSLDVLLDFKGVGRKTANLVLSLGYGQDTICVDTHVHRISNRWGAVSTKTPEETEFALMEKIPKKYWSEINDLMVAFGQTICRPIGPKCGECKVKDCPARKK
ncbi:MAG TPA: endonuclease III [Clostridiales bacterium]|nr:endonuclease III [Clostridiales bacterium]HQP69918.1 endonuclease III [Clostridiales bacterium]